MAGNYNAPSRSQASAETGLVWVEKIANGTGPIEVAKYAPIRVYAAALCTVSLDGVDSATIAAGEALIINAGKGDASDTKGTVTVLCSAAAYVSVARLKEEAPQKD